MTGMKMSFRKGDIYLVKWDPSEYCGRYYYRPMLLLQNDYGEDNNERIFGSPVGGLVLDREEVYLPLNSEEILFPTIYRKIDMVTWFPKKNLTEKIGSLSRKHAKEIDDMMKLQFGLYFPDTKELPV